MKSWRWTNPEETIATDDEGTFAPKGSIELALFLAGDPDADPPIPPGVIHAYQRFVSLEEAKIHLMVIVRARAAELRFAAAGTSDAGKLAVDALKYDLAVAALAGDAVALTALTPEAMARGQTPANFAAMTKSSGDEWRAAALTIETAYAKHEVAIAALATLDAALVYDTEAHWPPIADDRDFRVAGKPAI